MGRPTDRPFTEADLRRKLEARGYRATHYVYAPGTCFPPHTDDCDKIDAVLSGRFRAALRGENIVLEAGDAIAIPRGVVHAARLPGDEPVVSLDAFRIG